jgi:mannitol/fructose-specific phosphotransferase system IIA component (Ntr-type)
MMRTAAFFGVTPRGGSGIRETGWGRNATDYAMTTAKDIEFKAALERCCFEPELKGETKEDILDELLGLLADAGCLPDRQAARKAIMEREAKMSTGMQHGVAIPHGKTDTIDMLVSAFGIKKDGVDFDALDGEPSRIFVMTVSSVCHAGPHMRYLAEIGKILNRPSVRKRLLKAKTRDEIIGILTE